jgi:ribosomal peptide maturation radical SAM protein 1
MALSSAMRIDLISLPWKKIDTPPLGVCALSAYINKKEPDWVVCNHYPYLDIAHDIGVQRYRVMSENAYELCEGFFAGLLYPENKAPLKESFIKWGLKKPRAGFGVTYGELERQFESILVALENHLENFVQKNEFGDIVGLSACFYQTFASILFGKRIKERYPGVTIILGGIGVSRQIGRSILGEYPYIDGIVQGEGEQPFLALARQLNSRKKGEMIKGVILRKGEVIKAAPGEFWELPDLDQLPTPDFVSYFEKAYDQYGLERIIPIEGSRGCWWDRRNKSGCQKDACAFCNLNIQWRSYREKSAKKIVTEILDLSRAYKSTSFEFMDNCLKVKKLIAAVGRVKRKNMKLIFSCALRPNITPYEILLLAEAGLDCSQVGIESLSSKLLHRMNKGTTVIKNLEIMKTFFELGFGERFDSNLIVNFPATTQEEIDETIYNIRNFGIIYSPLQISDFSLYRYSAVETCREEFKIANLRNSDKYRGILPDKVLENISMMEMSFDGGGRTDGWEVVYRRMEEWRDRHINRNFKKGWPLLAYHDGGSFLRIEDNRQERREFILEGLLGEIYLYCSQIRTFRQVKNKYFDRLKNESVDLKETFDLYASHGLLFVENNQCLALAVAPSIFAASDRIRRFGLQKVNQN